VRQEGGIYALYLADRRASAKVHAFTEFLAKRFGSPPLLGPDLGLVVASRVEHRHTICAIKKAVEMSWKPVHILAFNSTSIGGTLAPAGLENAKGIVSVRHQKPTAGTSRPSRHHLSRGWPGSSRNGQRRDRPNPGR
jgi:hypothetical protein